jgi:hypothetical protein
MEEVIDLLTRVASTGFESVSANNCLEVVKLIDRTGDDRAISLRLLEPSFRKVIYAPSDGVDWLSLS